MSDDPRPADIDVDALVSRMLEAESRLATHAAAARPGLTGADAATGERWEAGQVWGHLAEFPAYWVGQVRALLAAHEAGEPEPIPFGRTRTDPARLAAIERGRRDEPLTSAGRRGGRHRRRERPLPEPQRRRVADVRAARHARGDDRGKHRRAFRRRPPRGACDPTRRADPRRLCLAAARGVTRRARRST